MAQHLFIFCLLSLLLFVNGDPFDFFQLVEQWGPNKCNSLGTQCHAQPQPMFTIHGLWPSNFSNAHLSCVVHTKFKSHEVTALEQDLNIYWPNVLSGKNKGFWAHEWENHGACTNPPYTIFQYFQISLNLRKNQNYDLLAILNDAGLNPQMPTNFVSQDILNPIKNATGKKPGIRCNNNGVTGKLQLFEIVLCFDKNAATLIDCPQFVSNSCPSTFVWLLPQQSSVGVPNYP